MKGIDIFNQSFLRLTILFVVTAALGCAVPSFALPSNNGDFMNASESLPSADSEVFFPEIDEKLTFQELSQQLPVARAASNPKAFFKWMEQIDWSRLNELTRQPAGSYLYWIRGTLKLSTGHISEAIVSLKKSLVFAGHLKAPFDTIVPKIHNNLALAYEAQRDYTLAVDHYRESVGFFNNYEHEGLNDQWLFFSLNNMANVFDKMGDYSNADTWFKEASRYIDTDTITRANSFFVINLLSFYQNSGQSQVFHDLQKKSETYFMGPSVSTEEKAFYLNMTGSMYFMEGKYQRAIHFKEEALSLARFSGNIPLITEIETHLVHCYLSAGSLDEATHLGEAILKSESKIDESDETVTKARAKVSVLLAKSYAYKEKSDEALSLLADTKQYLLRSKISSFQKIIIYHNIGQVYMLLENFQLAEKWFSIRFEYLKEHYPNNSIYIANSLFNLGTANFHRGNLDKAQDLFLGSIEVLSRGEKFQYHLNNEKISLLSHLYLAKICKARYESDGLPEHLACGMESIGKAMSVVDRFRSELEFDQDRITIAGRIEEALDLGIWLSAQNYIMAPNESAYNQFFAYAQRRKNNSLLEAIKEKNDQIRANLPVELFNAEIAAKSKIAALQYQLGQESEQEKPDQKKISYWQKSLMFSYQTLDSLKGIMRLDYPAYYQLKYQSPFISLKEAQESLDDDQAFLDLFLNGEYLLINLVTSDGVKVFHKQSDLLLIQTAREFVAEASRPFSGFATRDDVLRFLNNGYALYEAFLAPVSKEIEGKKLIVVPDNILASLPFEALVTAQPVSDMLFHNAPWLVRSHSVSYLYNAALLTSTNNKEQYYSRLTAFVPDYHGTVAMHDSVLTGVRQGLNSKLRPIPGASEEVDDIARIFRVNKFTGSKASVAHFEEQMQGNNILHLAMHSLISTENPMDSKLVFSPAESDTTGVLEAQTIYNLQTSSPLIALSSCNSGMGTSLPGEGIMSLSRAFTFAGAKSTLMTLWAVNDKSASRLVSSFYQNMKEGLSKDEALSEAKKGFLKTASPLQAHPYYWANYVITGNQSPLIARVAFFDKIHGKVTVVSASIVLLLLALIIWVRVRRKRTGTQ